MKEIVNEVDGFYSSVDIRVILSNLEIWNSGDKIESDTDATKVGNLIPVR